MSSRFDFLIRTSIEGDGEAIRRLGRVEQALGQAARNAAAGSVNKTALSQAQNKAAAALEKARANVMGSAAVQGMGYSPVGGASYTGPSKWRSYQPFGGKGGGGSWGPPGGGPPVLAGGNTWGGAIGREIGELGIGSRLKRMAFGGGIPVHVKAYLAGLLAMKAVNGAAGLAKSAGQLSAVKGTYDELSGGAEAGTLRTDKISEAVGGILSKAQIRKGVAGLATSGVRGLDGKALSDDNAALMLKGVTQLGRVGGFDSTEALARLQNAVSTGSTAGLDKILPGFDADLAVRKYMDDTGMEKDEVESTPGLQQSIVTQAIIDAIKVGFKNTPEAARQSGDSYDRLAAAAMDARDALIENVGASQEFKGAVEGMTKALKDGTPMAVDAAKTALAPLATTQGQLVEGGIAAMISGAAIGGKVAGIPGAIVGAMPGFWATGYGAGMSIANMSDDIRASRLALPEGFDQAAYDRKQHAFQQKIAGMTDQEYTDYKKTDEYKKATTDVEFNKHKEANAGLEQFGDGLLTAVDALTKFALFAAKIAAGPAFTALAAKDAVDYVAENIGGA